MNIETLLFKEIQDEFGELRKQQVGSDEYKSGVDGITKLMDRAIEIEKLNIEVEQKEKDRKEERKDRVVKNCLTASGIVLPILVTIWGTVKSLRFEETGSVTTIMGRGFVNKLLPKK
jgi:hypothetical protein